MENLNYFSPQEMNHVAKETATKKITMPKWKIFVLAIFAGFYIAVGGMLMILADAGSRGIVPFGVGRIIMGFAFSVGLIFVVLGGAELFTGSTVVFLSFLEKKSRFKNVLLNWALVWLGNFIGGIFLAILVWLSGRSDFGSGALAFVLKATAESKVHYGFGQAFVLGILCNIFVCLAIYLAISSKSVSGKIICIALPVMAFVAMGFEHSVANMFILSWDKIAFSNITWLEILFFNLLPVSLGNILGGLLLWVPYYYIYKSN